MQSTIKRPGLISIISILGFIWIFFSFLIVFSPSVKKMGDWYPALYGLFVASDFTSYIGLWNMKRWGVRLFLVTFFLKEMIFILANDLNYIGIGISVLFIIPMIVFYSRMDRNL